MSRPIDADALIQTYCGECSNKEFCAEQSCPYYEIRRRIELAPTVTAEPKRGRWLDEREQCAGIIRVYVCSECGMYVYIKFDYCPYCGARMDGGAENDKTD